MEELHGPSGAGTVVLDIGGVIGAAIVHAPASLAGREVEIRRVPGPWTGRHVSVRARHTPCRVVHAAIFEALESGAYEVRVRHGSPESPGEVFSVEGGRVAEVLLDGASRSPSRRRSSS